LLRWPTVKSLERWQPCPRPTNPPRPTILAIGRWALGEVCRQIAAWRAAGARHPPVAVNVSAVQLNREDLAPVIAYHLADYGLTPADLVVVVTESGAQRRAVHWVSPLMALRRLWPQTLFGAIGVGWFAYFSPPGALFFSPFFAIALLAVPIASLTSIPILGRLLAQIGLWRIPEETAPASADAQLAVLRDLGGVLRDLLCDDELSTYLAERHQARAAPGTDHRPSRPARSPWPLAR